MDHLSDLVGKAFPDSKVALEISCKHTKTRSIVKNVIAKRFNMELVEILRKVKLSLLIDESTDIASRKQLAIVVRFYCDKEMRVRSRFSKLIDVSVANAETLYNVTINGLEKSSIPIENIIGYAANTANVMFGQHNSVMS